VSEQITRLWELPGIGNAAETLPASAAATFWENHDALRTAPPFRAKLTALPASIESVAGEVAAPLLAALENPAFLWYATLGIGFVSGIPRTAGEVAAAVTAARSRLPPAGSLVFQAAPATVRKLAAVWGNPPRALELMRRVKERFDPERRLSPGRFVGGI